jgi:flagellar hook-associated protein 1 FlgK
MTTFSGLTNAAAALAAHSYAMQVTGQNIANADTPGYTRERVDQASTGPAAGVPSLYAVNNSNAGTVNSSGVTRMNDPIIDARARTEHGLSGYADTKAGTLSAVETNFDEPTDNGLSEQLNTFWNDWTVVANNPGDSAARSALLAQASTVTSSLNASATALNQLSTDALSGLHSSVDQINAAAAGVAQLNKAITVATASGAPSATLQDQRDLLLTQLATLGGTTTQTQPNGGVTVTMGGQTLVSGGTASVVALDGSNNVTVGAVAVTLTGGSAQAQAEALNTALPGYLTQLNAVASALASSVNAVHATGFDLNGAAGGAFFAGTTAATIGVAITDPNKVAASATGSGTPDFDSSIAHQIALLSTSTTGADAAYRGLVSTVGMDSQRAAQQSGVQDSVTSSVDALQSSVSGVSYDDEVTNLLAFQRAYQAASRVLTTIDETLDTLINRTGRVGL